MICIFCQPAINATDLFDWQGGFFESVKENHGIHIKSSYYNLTMDSLFKCMHSGSKCQCEQGF